MSPTTRTADVLVIGLGAMGSAALYQLARRGVTAIGLDRFSPPHDRGSSHGNHRLTREATGEGEAYIPLVRRTHAILPELEAETGETLLVRSGMLIIGSDDDAAAMHGGDAFMRTSIDLAQRFSIPHETMDSATLRRRFPQFTSVRDHDTAYLEPQSGFIHAEATIRAHLTAAQARGAIVQPHTPVTALRQSGGVVRVDTPTGTFEAPRVIVTAGAWTRGLLGAPFDRLLSVTRQAIHWYECADYAPYAPVTFPAFIWFRTASHDDYFSGFPVTNPAEGIKIVRSDEGPHVDHERLDMTVDPAESHRYYDHHVGPHLRGVMPRVVNARTCFYTVTPDNHFIVDEHPAMDRVTVVSACSGHGFKHAAGLGEAVAERVAGGRSSADLSSFSLARFK